MKSKPSKEIILYLTPQQVDMIMQSFNSLSMAFDMEKEFWDCYEALKKKLAEKGMHYN
jgi:hypothetical protein